MGNQQAEEGRSAAEHFTPQASAIQAPAIVPSKDKEDKPVEAGRGVIASGVDMVLRRYPLNDCGAL